MALHTFCHLNWPHKQIWTRDIDKCANAEFIGSVSMKTGTPIDIALQTSLRAYEGFVFENLCSNGNSKWVRPLGVYHRTRKRFGQQWCPECLSTDKRPYFRKAWRMSFIATCSAHGILLADRCHECSAPCTPHRGHFLECHQCEVDIRQHPRVIGESVALQAEYRLKRLARTGLYDIWRSTFTHSIAYFDTWYRLMGLIAYGKRAPHLRELIAKTYGGDPSGITSVRPQQLDMLSSKDMHKIHGLVARMMEGYPFRLVGLCAETSNWSTQLLKDMKPTRFDFLLPVKTYLAAPVIPKGTTSKRP